MDINENVNYSLSDPSVIFLSFLQQSPCLKQELLLEINRLEQEPMTNDTESEYDGDVETDGHSISTNFPQDLARRVEAAIPDEQSQIVRTVAAELLRIADNFNDNRFSQAAENLAGRLRDSTNSPQYWRRYLSDVVDGLMQDMPEMHSERMVMALTFSLLKAVCERAPCLLGGLLNTLMQYTFPHRA